MKEVVIIGSRQSEVRQAPAPKPGDGEVLVQMKAADVCSSDFCLLLGENPNAVYLRIPGYENAGVVVRVGKDVTSVQPDDAVVVSLVVTCGHCPQCLSGQGNIYRTAKMRGAAIDGGWREHLTVPEHGVYILPKGTIYHGAVLIEPFATDGHCTRRTGIQGGELVLVLGSGTIGAVILQTLKQRGCRVVCTDINKSSLGRVKEYSVNSVVNTKTQDLGERAQAFTNRARVDTIFDSACYPGSPTAVLEQGIPTNGTIIVPLGFCTEPEGITQAMINARELSTTSTRVPSGRLEPTTQNSAQRKLRLDSMVSHYIPFDQVDQVFENMLCPTEGMKEMVIMFGEQGQAFFRAGTQRRGNFGVAKDRM